MSASQASLIVTRRLHNFMTKVVPILASHSVLLVELNCIVDE